MTLRKKKGERLKYSHGKNCGSRKMGECGVGYQFARSGSCP
jgi:hypothetical protein